MNILELPLNLVKLLDKILFFEIYGFPLVILCLMLTGIYLSFKLGFPAQKYFKKSFQNIFKSDSSESKGLLSNTQSLFTSLSAIVGMGNVAGIAVAILVGGPGSLFWMIAMAFFGMNTSFAETLLACKYKNINEESKSIECAPVVYIKKTLTEFNLAKLGTLLSGIYIFFYPIGLIGSVLFQIKETTNVITNFEIFSNYQLIVTIIISLGVLYIASKGITGIAKIFEKLVPIASGVYILCGLIIILINITKLPQALYLILTDAFSLHSISGGILGTIAIGVKRGVYSNEAGLGAATTPYAAAKGDNIMEKACIGSLNPFLDTIVMCTLTGLLILVSGVYNPNGTNPGGILLIKEAFSSIFKGFDIVLTVFIIAICFTLPVNSIFNANNIWGKYFNKKFLIILYVFEFFLLISTNYIDFSQVLSIADTLYLSIMVPNLICLFINRNNIKKIFLENKNKI